MMMERVAFAEKKIVLLYKILLYKILKLEKTMLLTSVNVNKNDLD